MKARILLMLMIIFSANTVFSQGNNNELPYDNEDFNYIFKSLGLATFKFPIKQTSKEVFDIVIEEYRAGELKKSTSIINRAIELFNPFGIDGLGYFKIEKDSVYMHRFYFHKKDTVLQLDIKSHGFSMNMKFSLANTSTFDYSALEFEKIDRIGFLEINNPIEILYMYGNSDKESDKPLLCSNGLSKQQLIKMYNHIIILTVEKYRPKSVSP